PQGDPTAPLDRHIELQVVRLVVGVDDDAVGDLAVDDQFDFALVPGRHLPALRGSKRNLGCERYLRTHLDRARLLEIQLTAAGLLTNSEVERVGVAVGNVRLPLANSLAPLREINLVHLAELHVDTPLADPAAANAREVGLTARLEREAAIHDVVPAVPFWHA